MEKIRSKADSLRSLTDTSKIVRMRMADRRHSLDINDKSILRNCLDTLQSSISVRSVTGMSERLETIARQMDLKFMVHSANPNQHNFYISTETFYIEICIDQTGAVLETRIHHQTPGGSSMSSQHNTQSAPEISDCLSKGDFDTFCDHVKGLLAVYDMPDCSPLDKSRAWQALYTLEHDLSILSSNQSWVTDVNQMIHKTALGMVHNRAGGIPMKLRFFMPPYELLDTEKQTILPMNQATVVSKNLGLVASVVLQSSTTSHLLPLTSLISQNGEHLPITQGNSVPLPGNFCLSLDQPLPLSSALAKIIISITSIDWLDPSQDSPLLSLITKQASKGVLDPSNNRGLFVTLPDQQHCYFLTESHELMGQTVDKIPFRHPGQVPDIIDVLRRQALFNTLISSCVRTNSLEDVDTSTMFEVTCLDPTCQALSVTFEHPTEETMATAELSLTDLTFPRCRVYTSSSAICSEETANKVLQRSLSIPVTMRAVISRGKGDIRHNHEEDTEVPVGGGQHNGLSNQNGTDISNGGRFKMETGGRSGQGLVGGPLGTPTACDPGGGPGGGTINIKTEQMETDEKNTMPESLNRDGPQGAKTLPGALNPTNRRTDEPEFRLPSEPMSIEKTSKKSTENKSKSDFKSLDELSVSLTRGPLSGSQNTARNTTEGAAKCSKDGNTPIRPNVSITAISESSSTYSSTGSQQTNPDNTKLTIVSGTGIEIIPLGGKSLGAKNSPTKRRDGSTIFKGKLQSKVRDFKRSLSEDDKRRLHKKKRRDDKVRQSLNVNRNNNIDDRKQEQKSKLAGVIERLALQSGDSVEIKPVGVTTVKADVEPEITVDRVGRTRSDQKTLKPKLKLTIKGGKNSDSLMNEDEESLKTMESSFQIPKLFKLDTSLSKMDRPSLTPTLSPPTLATKYSSSKPSLLKTSKINERFITNPSVATVSKMRSLSPAGSSVQVHIVKSPVITSPTNLSPLDETSLTLIK